MYHQNICLNSSWRYPIWYWEISHSSETYTPHHLCIVLYCNAVGTSLRGNEYFLKTGKGSQPAHYCRPLYRDFVSLFSEEIINSTWVGTGSYTSTIIGLL